MPASPTRQIPPPTPALHCPSCGSPTGDGVLVCTSCGEALGLPLPAGPGPSILTAGFSCTTCGATMACEPGPRSSVCAFCGSTDVAERRGEGIAALEPEFVIPFRVSREQAARMFDSWCRKGFFTPGDVRMDKLQGIYLPFWTFSMRADSTWEADIGEWWYDDRSKTASIRHTEWHPLRGRHHSWYSPFLISGSLGLPEAEALAAGPFDLEEMRRYRPEYLAGWLAEPVGVSREEARADCRRALQEKEGERIRAFLPGDTQSGLEWTTTFSQVSDDLLLLPFWIGACTHRGKLYRYVLNGQTGKAATGKRPGTAAKSGLAEALSLPLPRCERCRELLDEGDVYCPSCGHAALSERASVGMPPPRWVIPFQIDQPRAVAIFREWLGRGTFRPGDLRQASIVTGMRGVFLPCWSFSAGCHFFWTADSDEIPQGSKAEWAPRFGEHDAWYEHLLVPASGALTGSETCRPGDWDAAQALPWTPELVRDIPAEAFSVPRKQARPLALAELEQRVRAESLPQIPGRHRKVRVNPLYTKLEAWPLLVPAWILAYEYRGHRYRFLVNGQTGRIEGKAPVSPWRLLAAAGLVVLALLLLVLLAGR